MSPKQAKSHATIVKNEISSHMYEKFDPFANYGVVEYLGGAGMTVDEYRGRGVCYHMLYSK